MERCLQLAEMGAGAVSPNPMVGAVLVHKDRIIGEGYHRQYGQAHAEVNCINSVSEQDRPLIRESTLFVSLEPCAHYGKTPPCSQLIIREQIPKVVIACTDPFAAVNGEGIRQLQAAGITVVTGICREAAEDLNRRFFTFHRYQRPWIILKWAQTADGFIAGTTDERLLISGMAANRLVHKWRSEEDAILVGARTAIKDDPQLTNRYWPGKSPVRLVLNSNNDLPAELHLLDRKVPTVIFNQKEEKAEAALIRKKLDENTPVIPQLMKALYDMRIQSVIIEGGAATLGHFISEGFWDEARVITNTTLLSGNGLPAPVLSQATAVNEMQLETDSIIFYRHKRLTT